MVDTCVICNISDDEELVRPGQIGIDSINWARTEINNSLHVKIGEDVHKIFRQNYIHKWYISLESATNNSSLLRRGRSTSKFDFRRNCFFCGNGITQRQKQNKSVSFVLSRNREIDKTIRTIITDRNYDDWALLVFGRVESANELHAEDAGYHHDCYSNFKSGCQIPAKRNALSEKNCKLGRPKDTLLDEAYSKVCTLLWRKGT